MGFPLSRGGCHLFLGQVPKVLGQQFGAHTMAGVSHQDRRDREWAGWPTTYESVTTRLRPGRGNRHAALQRLLSEPGGLRRCPRLRPVGNLEFAQDRRHIIPDGFWA